MLLASRDLARPQPDIVRAVITIHELHRDARRSDAVARVALALAGPAGRGTLLLTPRCAGAGHGGPADMLRWPGNSWMDGRPAASPAPVGSFAVVDRLLARLSDRRLFPTLATVVLVGHSAGGQFVQRYAMLGRELGPAAVAGLAVRFVVVNPSSYAYPDRDRPTPAGGFAPGPAAACPGYDRWKYGLDALPAYAGAVRPRPSCGPMSRATSPSCRAAWTMTPRWPCWTDPAPPRRRAPPTSPAARTSSARCGSATPPRHAGARTRSPASATTPPAC